MAERRSGGHRRVSDRIMRMLVGPLLVAVVLLLVVDAVISVVALTGAHSANVAATRARRNEVRLRIQGRQIAGIERRDVRGLRRANYRICSRGNGPRAELHLSANRVTPGLLVLRERRLPIEDCAPNLIGRHARPLSTRQQRVFVREYAEENRTPLVRNGRVVN